MAFPAYSLNSALPLLINFLLEVMEASSIREDISKPQYFLILAMENISFTLNPLPGPSSSTNSSLCKSSKENDCLIIPALVFSIIAAISRPLLPSGFRSWDAISFSLSDSIIKIGIQNGLLQVLHQDRYYDKISRHNHLLFPPEHI